MNHLIKWLLIPITAYATINPVSIDNKIVNPQNAPILEESMTYESPEIPNGAPISTSTFLAMYLPADMMPVINCESHFQQWDENGHILTSSTDDVGIAQINVKTWGAKASELGYDIYTTEGNLKMAKYVLDTQGKTAWVCYHLLNS